MTTAKDAPAEPREAVERFPEAVEEAAAGQAVLFEQAMKIPQEFSRFYVQRMGRDLEMMQALGRCRTPADLVNVWTEAAHAAAEDYRSEMTRMVELVTNGSGAAKDANGASRPKKKS